MACGVGGLDNVSPCFGAVTVIRRRLSTNKMNGIQHREIQSVPTYKERGFKRHCFGPQAQFPSCFIFNHKSVVNCEHLSWKEKLVSLEMSNNPWGSCREIKEGLFNWIEFNLLRSHGEEHTHTHTHTPTKKGWWDTRMERQTHCEQARAAVCVCVCVCNFGSLTDICCEGQVSVRMEPINGSSARTPPPPRLHLLHANTLATKYECADTKLSCIHTHTHTHTHAFTQVCSDKPHKYTCVHTWKQPGPTHVCRRNLALDSRRGAVSCYNAGLTGAACRGWASGGPGMLRRLTLHMDFYSVTFVPHAAAALSTW